MKVWLIYIHEKNLGCILGRVSLQGPQSHGDVNETEGHKPVKCT